MGDAVKVEVVGPVMTNTDNPWRTQGDYLQAKPIHYAGNHFASGGCRSCLIILLSISGGERETES
jgi:hypothetical protein